MRRIMRIVNRLFCCIAAANLAVTAAGLSGAKQHTAYAASEVQDLKGDINGDGEFNISDVVVLQKWLLAMPSAELADWKAGDLCKDGRLDVFDLCLLRRELFSNGNSRRSMSEMFQKAIALYVADIDPDFDFSSYTLYASAPSYTYDDSGQKIGDKRFFNLYYKDILVVDPDNYIYASYDYLSDELKIDKGEELFSDKRIENLSYIEIEPSISKKLAADIASEYAWSLTVPADMTFGAGTAEILGINTENCELVLYDPEQPHLAYRIDDSNTEYRFADESIPTERMQIDLVIYVDAQTGDIIDSRMNTRSVYH